MKVSKNEKDMQSFLKNYAKSKKDNKIETIDASNHRVKFDFEIYNSLLPKGVTIISK